jgi:hypothetical protein
MGALRYCSRCGCEYDQAICACPECKNPEFGLRPDVLTERWREDMEPVYFVPQDKAVVKRVCTRKHAEGHVCDRPHAVPADAVWSGTDRGRAEEVTGEFKLARREKRRAARRWEREKIALANKQMTAAPAFSTYARQLLERHLASRPTTEVKIA